MSLALLFFAIIPVELVVEDRVTAIELNHFYNEQGQAVFDQLIFYSWHPDYERYDVVAWRLVRGGLPRAQKDWRRGGYTVLWVDGAVTRRVWALGVRETWTQEDPEQIEQAILPKEHRDGLTNTREK